ncbi:MAG: hypothetical protein QXU61_04035, partial [Archaeoglobaceae archaeon]
RIEEFENWLRGRGYDKMMGEQNLKSYLNLGFAPLLFSNSNLLMSFLFSHLKVSGEREKVRFELAKRIKSISASKEEIRIEMD